MKIRNLATRKVATTPIQLAILTLITSMGAAHAQTQAPAPATSSQAKANSESTTISEVIVTGTKRATSLQKTPVAITAINAAALEDAHVQNVQDVVNLVPGFQATGQGDHGVITMTMRGIGNDSAKTEYADPEVALFIDGIYAPRPEGATSLLFDLEGIEVLRGPQGTLWGRNATVGAVNMQTAKPKIGESSGSVVLVPAVHSISRSAMKWPCALPMRMKNMMATSIIKRRLCCPSTARKQPLPLTSKMVAR